MKSKINIAIFASGNGSNFEALIKAVKNKNTGIGRWILVTDKKNAFVRKRAGKYKIKDIFINPAQAKSRKEHEKKIIKVLREEEINLILLAGYMRILSPFFIRRFRNKILNIHPSLLPSFPGKKAIEAAYNYGCKVTGVTVHFVSEAVDSGPIIAQEAISLKSNMPLENLEKRIHRVEHRLYPYALNLFLNNKLKIEGRCVKVS